MHRTSDRTCFSAPPCPTFSERHVAYGPVTRNKTREVCQRRVGRLRSALISSQKLSSTKLFFGVSRRIYAQRQFTARDRVVVNAVARTLLDSQVSIDSEVERLLETVTSDDQKDVFSREMESFKELYSRWRETLRQEPIDWRKIETPNVIPYESLVDPHSTHLGGISQADNYTEGPTDFFGSNGRDETTSDNGVAQRGEEKDLMDKLVVLKLNGGLGTTMGCKGPKSVIEVRNDLTFLDLTVRQIQGLNRAYGVQIPLILMNSFSTNEETKKVIHRYKKHRVQVSTFRQHRFPRILKDSFTLVPSAADDDNYAWYPPGHGDVYSALCKSDLFDQLRKAGKQYVFISNIDNLGATVDLNIARHLDKNPDCEFLLEVTDRTRSDVKGGTLIDYEGRMRLLEVAQVPASKRDEFNSIKKFSIFNTNNIWVRLDAIEKRLPELSLDIIANHKSLPDGAPVIQLETAAGAAIQHFQNAAVVNVPRYRFLPVKGCSDLFVVQSNLYNLEHNCLRLNPKRVQLMGSTSLPVVKLGEQFQKVSDYHERFQTIPDILELDHLTVSGDVTFGSNVVLKGTVIVVANHGSRIDIPSGAVLENKVVSGSLRILDH
mmetsp:Transcript_15700/g.25843  ORF Transcript_15700/g.25843 Transcript_15700/m.25843 type:complete len:603 (+) Transcript_15700:101-1909(+)